MAQPPTLRRLLQKEKRFHQLTLQALSKKHALNTLECLYGISVETIFQAVNTLSASPTEKPIKST